MQALCAERAAGGAFTGLCDLTARLAGKGFNRRLLEALARAGALDRLAANRATLMAGLEQAIAHAGAVAAARESTQEGLFGSNGDDVPEPRIATLGGPWVSVSVRVRCARSLSLGTHPLDGYAAALAERGVVAAAQVLESARPLRRCHGRARR
ncbi:MAG: hypothetical protein R3C69_01270 [Geminicoccaceae bacterium]